MQQPPHIVCMPALTLPVCLPLLPCCPCSCPLCMLPYAGPLCAACSFAVCFVPVSCCVCVCGVFAWCVSYSRVCVLCVSGGRGGRDRDRDRHGGPGRPFHSPQSGPPDRGPPPFDRGPPRPRTAGPPWQGGGAPGPQVMAIKVLQDFIQKYKSCEK
jgi:hypothetical protein